MAQPVLNRRSVNVSLYQSAAALDANSRWQEIIAENLSAGSIPGYKKQEVSFSAIQSGLIPAPAVQGAQSFVLPQANTAINFRQGELKYTGANTDVALEGSGFLMVQLPDGSTGYTRDGELRLDASGQLLTKQGYPVLGDGGPIQLDLTNAAPMSIASTGEVSQGMDLKGTLKAVEFNNPSLLTSVGSGIYVARNQGLQVIEPGQTNFRQNFIEASNTSPTTEMAMMISAMRLYEANQRTIQAQDERMGRAIAELGHPGQ